MPESVQLIDVLYRDPPRLTSFIAQLNDGHIISSEFTNSSRSADELGGKAGFNLGFNTTVDKKKTSDVSEQLKEVKNPHDALLRGLLMQMEKNGLVRREPVDVTRSQIVHLEGTLCLIESSLLRVAANTLSQLASSPKAAGVFKSNDRERAEFAKTLFQLFDDINLPTLLKLETDSNTYIGHIKPDHLEDPIGSYHLRTGRMGIPDVTVIGITESRKAFKTRASDPGELENVLTEMTQHFRGLFIPDEKVRYITPLLIYRTISG